MSATAICAPPPPDVMAARLLRTEKMRAETEVRKAAEREEAGDVETLG